MLYGTVLKVWGCITTCEDRLLMYQLSETKTREMYYIVSELSIEINRSYTYKEKDLPPILREMILLCELARCFLYEDPTTHQRILYGPHIALKKNQQMVYQINQEYFGQEIGFDIYPEDHRIKIFYKWLKTLIDHLV
jgi:hypothetical protein